MLADQGDRIVDIARAEQTGHSCQSRAKNKRFDVVHPVVERVDKLQQHATIAVHRAADVAQHHEWTAPIAWRPIRHVERLAGRTHARAHDAAQIDNASALVASGPPRPPQRRAPLHAAHHVARLLDFVVRVAAEVARSQGLAPAVDHGRADFLLLEVVGGIAFVVVPGPRLAARQTQRALRDANDRQRCLLDVECREAAKVEGKRRFENRHVIGFGDQRAQGSVVQCLAVGHGNVCQRCGEIEQIARADTHAHRTQQMHEADDVLADVPLGHAEPIRARMARTASPRICWRSS